MFNDKFASLSTESLANNIENQIITLLNISNINDRNNVQLYTRSIIKYNNYDFNELKTSFLAFFEIIKIYNQKEESKLKNKLIKVKLNLTP